MIPKREPPFWTHRALCCAGAVALIGLSGIAGAQETVLRNERGNVVYDGYVEAKASAQQSGWAASNPADVTLQFQVNSGVPQRQWVPNPPVAEASWDNDNWVAGGNFSWHTAVSGPNLVEGQGKAKAGLNADGSVCVDARARVRNCASFFDIAYGYGKARMSLPLIVVLGPGLSADATLHTTCYAAAPAQPASAMAGETTSLIALPAGVPLTLQWEDTAEARYPQIMIWPYPGSHMATEMTINGSPAYYGTVDAYQETANGPLLVQANGDLTTMLFHPWSGTGPEGQSFETETGGQSFYGAIRHALTLPIGYSFAEAPGCPAGSLFSQTPHGPGEAWSLGTSEEAPDVERYESYHNPDGQASGGIRFWGISAHLDPFGGNWWVACSENPMPFHIRFYEDAGGVPGPQACTYDVTLTGTDTGLTYDGWPLYQYDTELAPGCSLANGWVSIVGAGDSTCWFRWMSSGAGDHASQFLEAGLWGSANFDLSVCITPHPEPFPEFVIASTAQQWGDQLIAGSLGGITPIETLGSNELEEIAELGMTESQFRPARLYPVENLDSQSRDGMVMAFGDEAVPVGEQVIAGFDYHLGYNWPTGYGFWSGHSKDLRWCWRRLQFWNYWYWPPYYYYYGAWWPWWSQKLIVFYDVNGNRLLLDYQKWWRWWPWPNYYWWKFRLYPYYPWPWWGWWQPFNSYRTIGPFDPWRVVMIRYWETAWWYPLRPYPPTPWLGATGPWWPPTWPYPKDGSMRQNPPEVPWNAWGDMMVEAPDSGLPPCGPTAGDGDGDGDVDLADYVVFQNCLDYPGNENSERCGCLDFDGNQEIDIADFAGFQRALGGTP